MVEIGVEGLKFWDVEHLPMGISALRAEKVMLGSPLQTPEGELGVAFPPENLPKASWPQVSAIDPAWRLRAPVNPKPYGPLFGIIKQVQVGVMEDENEAPEMLQAEVGGGRALQQTSTQGRHRLHWLVRARLAHARVRDPELSVGLERLLKL